MDWIANHLIYILCLISILAAVANLALNEESKKKWSYYFAIAAAVGTMFTGYYNQGKVTKAKKDNDSIVKRNDSLQLSIESNTKVIARLSQENFTRLEDSSIKILSDIKGASENIKQVSQQQKVTLSNINGSQLPPLIQVAFLPNGDGDKILVEVNAVNKSKLPIRGLEVENAFRNEHIKAIIQQDSSSPKGTFGTDENYSDWRPEFLTIGDIPVKSGRILFRDSFIRKLNFVNYAFELYHTGYQYRITFGLKRIGRLLNVYRFQVYKGLQPVKVPNLVSILSLVDTIKSTKVDLGKF